MNQSQGRIVTSHTGSLPRPPDLIELLRRRESGEGTDDADFQTRVHDAVAESVKHQVKIGIDIVSDGEQGKPSYATYVKDRLTGFGRQESGPISVSGEARDFPEFFARRLASAATLVTRPVCDGPIAWRDFAAVQGDIDNLRDAMQVSGATAGFMTAASPGIISFFLTNRYYASLDAYHEALVEVMRDEYEAITNAGFELQLDCPDLTGTRQSLFADASLAEYRAMVARHIELVNEATRNIAPERMRMHLCWGNYEGPHHRDIALADVVDIILKARPQVISFEAANPRHAHEWVVWEETELPEDKVLMPGVIDSTTNFIEHPELVAQRLVRFAELVGKERLIAGVDCGFGTNADLATVDPKIAWAKLASLIEGARLAGERC